MLLLLLKHALQAAFPARKIWVNFYLKMFVWALHSSLQKQGKAAFVSGLGEQ